MIHGVGFMMFRKIARLLGGQAIVEGQRLKEIQTGIAERMLPQHGEPVFLDLPVVNQGSMEIGQRSRLRKHGRDEYFLCGQTQGLASAKENLNVTRRAGMAELVEH